MTEDDQNHQVDETAAESDEATVLPFRRKDNESTEDETTPDATDTDAEVIEGELVEPEPVDQSQPQGKPNPLVRQEKRQPILPAWAKSASEFRDAAQWFAGYASHAAGYHVVRCPVYAARIAGRMPQGGVKILRAVSRWLSDAEGHPVRNAVARREEAGEYLKLSRQRDGRVRARGFLFAGLAAAGITVVLVGHAFLPILVQWAAVVLAAGGLGWFGAPADRPVVSRAVETMKAPKLTSNVVETALNSLGIAQITAAVSRGNGISFPKPIARDGKGWRADVDLPEGVTPGDIVERRAKLASGLRRPLGCVWPERDPSEHEARLILWVGDQDMRKATQPAWPLRKGKQVDLFQSQPFGTDQRGRWVTLTLMYISAVIGAIPRMGKTFALRELLLVGGLDPRAELHTYDMKGTGDLDPLEPVVHRHGVGDEDDVLDYALADMRAVREELRRRVKAIRDLAKQGLCPENKVTTDLASKASLGLHPIVIGVDECQVWFEHPEYGEEFEEICTDLVKRGPAAGIVLLLATQRPDAKSIPTGIGDNASTRFCLKVRGQAANDMVLGTSAYKNGTRATTFAWEDKGIGYLLGEGADAQIVRTVAGLDGHASEKVVGYARALREAAGTLSGHAIGQQPETASAEDRDTLLEDILVVVPETEKKVWNERVIARLAELRPEVYGTYSKAEDLTAALRRHGIRTAQVWGSTDDGRSANRIGLTRSDITEEVTKRDRQRETG